jgi:hypothetical protein
MVKKTREHLASDSKLTVGPHTYGPLEIQGQGKVIIGDYCSIARDVKIILSDHYSDWITTYPFSAVELTDEWPAAKDIGGHPHHKGDVVIGNDVWLGRGATILSGVYIGDGSVIGAGSVVSKSIPPYAIAAGNPCEVKKYRFSSVNIKFLLKLKWWNWPESEISRHMHLLCSNKIEMLRGAYEESFGYGDEPGGSQPKAGK